MSFENVDWDELRAKLPYEKTDEEKEKRMELFKRFDVQGNGILSLAEVTKGIRDELHLEDVLVKAPVDEAFHRAKAVNKESKADSADDYIDKREFRMFLFYLRQYFEYYVAFDRLDESGDHKVDLEELRGAWEKLKKWVKEDVEDVEEVFKKIDKDGGGQIRFKEFCTWALEHGLDIEDDDE